MFVLLSRWLIPVVCLLIACGADGPVEPPEPTDPPGDAADEQVVDAQSHAVVGPGGGTQGGVVIRSGDRVFVVDEDRSMLRVLGLPVAEEPRDQREVPLPGPPAAVVAIGEGVLVTIRDPGLVLKLRANSDGSFEEVARAEVAADAWGITLTLDGRAALVTSAWTHTVSLVELEGMSVVWSVNVPREPRAVVVVPGTDSAYVTHLIGASLTRIDHLSGDPKVRRVAFPAAPLRTPDDGFAEDRAAAASLAYSAVLSPDAKRLFVPRHALGATGKLAWNGQPTVDVLLTEDETPLARREGRAPLSRIDVPLAKRDTEVSGVGPMQRRPIFAQPRAVIYRASTNTLLVASEGRDALVELDALSVDPSANWLRRYELNPWTDSGPDVLSYGDSLCGAPSGVALSEDEYTAYVFCRSTATLAVVTLQDGGERGTNGPWWKRKGVTQTRRITLADDPLDAEAALGRRLFYNATDNVMSFGFGCAGCHPDGRDDGHVWHDVGIETGVMRAFPEAQAWVDLPIRGEPRQTPMLAGRVDHDGPFGWRGESKTLEHRILRGFEIHHWYSRSFFRKSARKRASALAAFLRRGLPSPPVRTAALTATEEQGRELFTNGTTGCASCHVADTGYTDHRTIDLDLRQPNPLFRGAERARFRTPSLRFVAGTGPFLHDGSAPSLVALIDENHDRMGATTQLSDGERTALVAFLRTLDGPASAPASLPVVHPPARDKPVGHDTALSPEPGPAEWATADRIPLARPSDICDAHRIREWVKVQCRVHVAEAQLIGGSPVGVRLTHSVMRDPDASHWWRGKIDDLVVVFPTRPGDRRVIQGLSAAFVGWWGGADFDVAIMVSESWLDGEMGPTITAF